MAFNLEEWNKLSEAECERRYKQRLRNEERGKNLAAVVAFVLLGWLLIAVYRASPTTTIVEPGAAFADRHMKRWYENLQTLQLRANRNHRHRNNFNSWPNLAALKNRSSDLRTIGIAIWKAVAMAPVFRSLGGVETCGGRDFAPVTGYYRPGRGDLRLGGISFWGDFTATGAITTAFQIAALTALSCGEFGRGSLPKPLTEGQAGREPGFRISVSFRRAALTGL